MANMTLMGLPDKIKVLLICDDQLSSAPDNSIVRRNLHFLSPKKNPQMLRACRPKHFHVFRFHVSAN